jgi:hypothetical protein
MMSYFSQAENTAIDASFEFLQTPMAVDWIALDDIYGAFGYGTDNAFTGDTVYGFNTTISADVSRVWNAYATYADQTASTIVDGDGIDTLDFSGFDADQRIDLTVQYATDTAQITSDIGGRVGNLTLGIGTVIENAVGGGGDDAITGNAADNTLLGGTGDDTLTGAGGDDTLRGGDGMDTAVFAGAFGDYDFTLSAGDTELWIASLGGDDGLDTIATDIEFLQFGDGAASTLVLGGSGLIASVETTDETGATIAAITRADDGSTVAEEYVAGVLSIRETVEADGDVKTLSYDAGGRLDTVAFEDVSDIRNWESYSNAYDDTGSRIAYDLLLDNGRIHNRTYQDGVLATHATTEADGDIRLRTYDAQGRTDSVTVQDISQTRSWESYSNSYDESGDRIAYDITFDNGKVHNRTYQDGTLATHTITDANGDTRTSTYDSAGRLDSFEFRDDSQTRSWESYTNTYDDAGNRKAYDVAYDSGQTLNRAFTDGILASQTVIEVDGDVKTTTYRADGAREMFVFEDVSDSRNWESYTDTFDEAGGFIDREYVWDVA